MWLTHRAVHERQGDTKDPRMTGCSTINDGLHNPVGSFHGPHPEKTDRKKTHNRAPSSTTPHRPQQFGLFYAYLLGERMGTAAGERCRTEEPDGLFCRPPQVLMRRYSNLFTVYENHTVPITFKSALSIQQKSLRAYLTCSF